MSPALSDETRWDYKTVSCFSCPEIAFVTCTYCSLYKEASQNPQSHLINGFGIITLVVCLDLLYLCIWSLHTLTLKYFHKCQILVVEKKNHFRHDHIRNLALGSCDLNLTAWGHWCHELYNIFFRNPGKTAKQAMRANVIDISLRSYRFHPVNPFSCYWTNTLMQSQGNCRHTNLKTNIQTTASCANGG